MNRFLNSRLLYLIESNRLLRIKEFKIPSTVINMHSQINGIRLFNIHKPYHLKVGRNVHLQSDNNFKNISEHLLYAIRCPVCFIFNPYTYPILIYR